MPFDFDKKNDLNYFVRTITPQGEQRIYWGKDFPRALEEAGAKVAVVTAVADSRTAREADHVLLLPAQTMASDLASHPSHLPMGSLFEVAMMLTFELLALRRGQG